MHNNDKPQQGSDSPFSSLVKGVRAYQRTIDPADLSWRRNQLKAMKTMLADSEPGIVEALRKDLGKSATEALMTETGIVGAEIDEALKNLHRWSKAKKVGTPLVLQPGSSRIIPEPLGVALIIGAWNYPVNLMLAPLVGCIAAGNAAILKPSELAPATAEVLADILPRYLDPQAFHVVTGGVPETTALLEERFDKIFFTGSGRVGGIVMEAAAKHMTPVTLALGGKSPCIVDSSAGLDTAARRIVFGKFTNAGQTCVAPDYVLAHKDIVEPLTEAFRRAIERFYGSDPQASPDYGRIVSPYHYRRLVSLMEGNRIVHGGRFDSENLYIEPTIIADPDPVSPIMQEEIFGPLLPVIQVDSMSEAFNFAGARERPLALYVFSRDRAVIRQAEKVRAGGMCINDTIVHLGVPGLPFGGTGGSGFGKYHGEAGFREFSNSKAIYEGSASVDLPVRYPPYGRLKKAVLDFFLK